MTATTMKSGLRTASHSGFSLLEVMISIVVLMVGLVSLLGVFGIALATTQTAQQDLIAKQLANEALESIITARDSSQLPWASIQNVSNGGIFVDNPAFQPINNPGADGIVGTADDAAAGGQVLQEPGPDGIIGTADDVFLPLTNYQRSIQIANLLDANNNVIPTLRSITVTIRYYPPQATVPKTFVLNSYISQFR